MSKAKNKKVTGLTRNVIIEKTYTYYSINGSSKIFTIPYNTLKNTLGIKEIIEIVGRKYIRI